MNPAGWQQTSSLFFRSSHQWREGRTQLFPACLQLELWMNNRSQSHTVVNMIPALMSSSQFARSCERFRGNDFQSTITSFSRHQRSEAQTRLPERQLARVSSWAGSRVITGARPVDPHRLLSGIVEFFTESLKRTHISFSHLHPKNCQSWDAFFISLWTWVLKCSAVVTAFLVDARW